MSGCRSRNVAPRTCLRVHDSSLSLGDEGTPDSERGEGTYRPANEMTREVASIAGLLSRDPCIPEEREEREFSKVPMPDPERERERERGRFLGTGTRSDQPKGECHGCVSCTDAHAAVLPQRLATCGSHLPLEVIWPLRGPPTCARIRAPCVEDDT
jgi:hypothetical protein